MDPIKKDSAPRMTPLQILLVRQIQAHDRKTVPGAIGTPKRRAMFSEK
jgi:hypothetical protein